MASAESCANQSHREMRAMHSRQGEEPAKRAEGVRRSSAVAAMLGEVHS